MNRQGHVQTLVAAHPGNRNAVKAGVFSPATLSPRVDEVEAALEGRPEAAVATELLRREVAALVVLAKAMDASLSEEGLVGRGGEPRRLISLRLQLNQRYRQTLDRYTAALASERALAEHSLDEPGEPDTVPQTLADTISELHLRESISDMGPEELDPEQFLRAIVLSDDPEIELGDRLRARKRLSRRRPPDLMKCTCFATLRARDEIEFQEWIKRLREAGVQSDGDDARYAALVRRLGAGERLVPWDSYRRSEAALREAVAAALGGTPATKRQRRRQRSEDSPFWRVVLAAEAVTPKARYEAFVALDDAGALPKCACKRERRRLPEDDWDADRAFVIRMVAQKHYRAAAVISLFPETYCAVRDAVDTALLSVESSSSIESNSTEVS
jgi:hypothetical protein